LAPHQGRPRPTPAQASEAITGDILTAVPARRGHFLLESSYHTDLWLTLDGLFRDPVAIAPLVEGLADKLRPHAVSAVCGPLLGGAFLAQALARILEAAFYYTEPSPVSPTGGLFEAAYRLPPDLSRHVRGERVAVVDDVISAGSSVRATIAALTTAGASTSVVGALLVLGESAVTHFASRAVPLETLGRRPLSLWEPAECPLCGKGAPLEDPGGPRVARDRNAPHPSIGNR
jgi:orotate phosphoribosyltransferase